MVHDGARLRGKDALVLHAAFVKGCEVVEIEAEVVVVANASGEAFEKGFGAGAVTLGLLAPSERDVVVVGVWRWRR